MFICEISVIIILICQKLESVGPVQQKIKLPQPKKFSKFQNFDGMFYCGMTRPRKTISGFMWRLANLDFQEKDPFFKKNPGKSGKAP